MTGPPRPAFPAAGVASAVGSMPGTDPHEAAAVVAGELPDLPHLPELPARGPGADLVGRATALLPALPVDRVPSGWRLTARPGLDARRASSYLSHDLDALEEALAGRTGPVKVAVAGPWTLAAALQLPRGEPVLGDRGAVRDLVQALAEGVAGHLADLRRRLPGSDLVLQLDEPSLPDALAGRVGSFSGLRAVRPVSGTDATTALGEVVAAARGLGIPTVGHCCAATPPVATFMAAGMAGVSVDLLLVGDRCDEALGEAAESGAVLLAGVVPAVGGLLSEAPAPVDPVRRLWHRLGLAPETMGSGVVVTPTCGLAAASPGRVRTVLRLCREGARALVDEPDRSPEGNQR